MSGYNYQIPHKKRNLSSQVFHSRHQRIHHQVTQQEDSIHLERKGKLGTISRLETGVSMLQTSKISLNRIHNWLEEMREFLDGLQYRFGKPQITESVINNFLADRLWKIKMTALDANFNSHSLLNGMLGVSASVQGNRLYFVRGSDKVVSSVGDGYPVMIGKTATRSTLQGNEPITPENIQKERKISLFEGSNELHYHIKHNENPLSLVKNLQSQIYSSGLDLQVFRTTDNHLAVMHNQFGSFYQFFGMSENTGMISEMPGETVAAQKGVDIVGSIADEEAIGRGAFLIGSQGNQRTDGLILYYDGTIRYPWEMVGKIVVTQNSMEMPLDIQNSQKDLLLIPSMLPEHLAVGVTNHSGFRHLEDVKGGTELHRMHAVRLVLWALADLDDLMELIQIKEKLYISKAIEILRSPSQQQRVVAENTTLSPEKASLMANQLREILSTKKNGYVA